MGQFCTSRLFQEVIALFALHDVSAMIQLFRFFLPFFRYRGGARRASRVATMRHTLLLCNMVSIMEAAVDQYPRHRELASVIQAFLVEMVSEGECAWQQ